MQVWDKRQFIDEQEYFVNACLVKNKQSDTKQPPPEICKKENMSSNKKFSC